MRQEVSFTHNRIFYCLIEGGSNSEQLYLIESKPVHSFYLLEFTSSCSVSYQIVLGKDIIFEGTLTKHRAASTNGTPFLQLLSSVEGNNKLALSLTLN